MSFSHPTNTLAYHLSGRPLVMKRRLGDAPIKSVSQKVSHFALDHGSGAVPEREAIGFYMLNHAVKEISFKFDPEEPLPGWAQVVLEKYHEFSSRAAARAFYYLLLITVREARHDKSKASTASKAKGKIGTQALLALKEYPDTASISSVQQVFDKYGEGLTLEDVAKSVQFCFYNGSFHSGYGGEKWGVVADCLVAFVTGEASAETMLDTVWTLCHNGGPIFNKGMLYDHYDAFCLRQVLDIQRSGQIPRLVLGEPQGSKVLARKYVTEEIVNLAKMVEASMESKDFVSQPVDFNQVHALGSVGKYNDLIGGKAGSSVYPKAPSPIVKIKVFPVVDESTHYIVMHSPDFMFKKLDRKELVA